MTDETDTFISLPYIEKLTYREWHALIDGAYCGYTDTYSEDEEEYDVDKHYWRATYIIFNYYFHD